MVVALKPLYDAFGIKRIVVATYQAVSGAGKEGLDESKQQIQDMAAGKELKVEAFQHQIACNVIPHIDIFLDNDYTKEEMKMTWETQKMLHDENILLSATAVRVPVYRSHAEAVHIETEKPVTAAEARAVLAKAPGVIIQDDPANNIYPMPLYSSDTDEVYVGRIRKDIAVDNGLSLFVVADQIRKGAATNAVQIAQLLVEEGLV
jgi:aspartate-semialdehyde dehydrogenase